MAELGVFGVGVATADAELRQVGANNTSVCTVNLAFNRSFKDKNDQWQTEPCFVRAQVWGNKADRMGELVRKGQPIYVSGFLKQDSWEDDKGQKRVSYSINLKEFQLCERNGTKAKTQNAPAPTDPEPNNDVACDDDIPF